MERTAISINLHNAAGDHRPQPFPNVPLIQAGGLRDLLGGGWCQAGHRVEESGLMADAGHEGEPATIQDANHLSSERLDICLIQLLRHHAVLPAPKTS